MDTQVPIIDSQVPTATTPLGELAAALAKAHIQFSHIEKNKTVEVKGTTKNGQPYKYEFAYADLEQLISATKKALSENGLVVMQLVGTNKLTTVLLHSSGQFISTSMEVPMTGTPQENGAKITYYRRYHYAAMLNLCAEDDDDGGAGGDTTITEKQITGSEKEKKFLTCEQLVDKMKTASNIFELDNRAKKYGDDYNALPPDMQVIVRRAKDTKKSELKGDK